MKSHNYKYTNRLINETSPYLLQHAHNPVDWYPWGKEALDKAKKENKLIIISIGYSACHWCHVMEHETFEDEKAAELMNENFVCIKVDREERPDIDQAYMNAVQILTGSGGWPLNCITLPDGRPVHGGTYFTREHWVYILSKLLDFTRQNPDKTEMQAEAIIREIRSVNTIYTDSEKADFTPDDLDVIFAACSKSIDHVNGGQTGAPKFPMPVVYNFLLHYHYITNNSDALNAVVMTLKRMAEGGIYDQISGGFSRYSTDEHWKVPHFEKMLYDNAQLVSLYSAAFQATGNGEFEKIVHETLDFIQREMTSEEGGFYSSLDADSEGREGRFYVWTYGELLKALGSRADLIIDYYNVSETGNWENGYNILFKHEDNKLITQKYNITEDELIKQVSEAKNILLNERNRRIRPGLDDKILTSWNALMLDAYAFAYRVFDKKEYLDAALKNAGFINSKVRSCDNRLNRNYKDGKSSIYGFLDDYAFTIKAFISLYQAVLEEKWLYDAEQLLNYAMSHFYDESTGMFFYTSDTDPALITRNMEIIDNVMPSSNSVMACNLFILGHYFSRDDYIEKSAGMLGYVRKHALKFGTSYANWNILAAWFAESPWEITIAGNDYKSKRTEFDRHYLPGVFFSGGREEGALPAMKDKMPVSGTAIYLCRNKSCMAPVIEVNDVLDVINSRNME